MAAHPTVGHTNALRAIGVRLREQGHQVAFSLTVARLPFIDRWPEPMRAAMRLPEGIAKDGLEVLPITPVLSWLWHGARIAGKTGYAELETALTLFTSGMERQATELAEHARQWKAEILVGDYLMPAAMLGAQLAKIPFVALYHSALPFPAQGAAPFGSGLADGSPTRLRADDVRRRGADLRGGRMKDFDHHRHGADLRGGRVKDFEVIIMGTALIFAEAA